MAESFRKARSGDGALTPANRQVIGAAGWLAFFRYVTVLYAEAHKQGGRRYLEWPEWNAFFQAAVKYGCITRAEISGDLIPIADYCAAHPRANRALGPLIHAALIETYRQVREAKARGDSPWQFARWQNENCAAYDALMADRERAATHTRKASATVSTLHDRKSRRRRDVDDADE